MTSEVSLATALQLLIAQLAIFQALLLIASAIHKIAKWRHSQGVLRQFAGVPVSMAAVTLCAAIAGELVAAAGLVLPAYRPMGAILAALLWVVYLGLILRAIAKDRRDVDCGCSFGSASRPLGAFQITRNAILVGLAVMVAVVSALIGSVGAQASQGLGAVALLLLYAALDQVMSLRPLRRGEAV